METPSPYPLAPTTLITITTLALLFYLTRTLLPRNRLPLPPGPPRLPLLGNVHQAPKSHPWLQYRTWSQTHGPLMHLSVFGQPVMVLSSAAAAHELLNRRSARYSERPRAVVAGELAMKSMHILLRPYDAVYRARQKMHAPLLSVRASDAYRPVQDLETRQLLFDLLVETERRDDNDDNRNSDGKTRQNGCDIAKHAERASASLAHTLFYGFRLPTLDDEDLRAVRESQDNFEPLAAGGKYLVDVFPALNVLPAFVAPWKREAERVFRSERDLHVPNVRRALAGPGWNFTKVMRRSVEGRGMNELEFALDLGPVAGAALDTTAVTLTWFVVAMMVHGETFLPRARRCLDDVVGRDRLPGFGDRDDPRMVYLEAVMEEVMRWRPIISAGVPHATKHEDEYMGYRIPAGSIVLPNIWAITRDEGVYGADTDAFVPERWLAGTEEHGDVPGIKNLPHIFGYGRRICPGRHIGRNSLWLGITRLLWAFDVELAGGGPHTRAMDDPLTCTGQLAMRPLPFKASFHPRGPWVREVISREWQDAQSDIGQFMREVETQRDSSL